MVDIPLEFCNADMNGQKTIILVYYSNYFAFFFSINMPQPHSLTAVKSYRFSLFFFKGPLHSREEGKNGSGDKKNRVSQLYKKDLKPVLGHIYFLFF